MCRWVAWLGKPVFMEDLISRPEHSLIHQSRDAHCCKTAINADGVGVAWYGARPEPGIYKDTRPAWSDPNLLQIARQIAAPVFLAHVRASTGSATSYNNCHPFAVGRWSFMHNGMVGGFGKLRRRAEMGIDEDIYAHRYGATDSEAVFLTALGLGLDASPLDAMAHAVRQLEGMAAEIGATPGMRFTSCWSDGHTLYAARYASDAFAPSMYYQRSAEGTLIVSEPLDSDGGSWTEVPPNTAVIATQADFSVVPFMSDVATPNVVAQGEMPRTLSVTGA
ncbi:class II glutamine amidotransferase [Roseicitreum antarcticum]|uniref:Glutamine amidotransferase n=1 Tax=Roseicitreum antarcticum TaxID=564137 RepID=A0A1H2VHY1_9RHOB|nr:glutamine amidotransferase [Roseicitreum antarcticum]